MSPGSMLRIAMLSVHTCPLAVLGGKETGGMNVYVRELSRELGRMGMAVDIFTRSQDPTIRRVVDMAEGVRVVHLPAGPEAPMRREQVHAHLDEFVDGVEAWRITRARSPSATTRSMAGFCERVKTSTSTPMRPSSRLTSRR